MSMLLPPGRRSMLRVGGGLLSPAGHSRDISTSAVVALPPPGFFTRPSEAPKSGLPRVTRQTNVAQPHTPPHIPAAQSPNKDVTWSESQNPRDLAMRGPRFEQINYDMQPLPLSAMEMISREPIRLTTKRIIECDGGENILPALPPCPPSGLAICPEWILSLLTDLTALFSPITRRRAVGSPSCLY